MFAEVKKFCCCMSLAVGTKIIGFTFTILAALLTGFYGLPAIVQMYSLPVSTLVFYELMTLTSALQFITGVLLIIGAFKKNTKLMRPWAVVCWWQNVVLVILALMGCFVYVMVSTSKEEEGANDDVETTLMIVIYTAYALVMYYAASVVDSHCVELSARRSDADDSLIEDSAAAGGNSRRQPRLQLVF